MMFEKKAQAQNAVFYIVGLVIVIMILVFGTYYFGKLKLTHEESKLTLFESKMSKDVTALKLTSSGSTTQVTYILPDGITEMCFVDITLAKENPDVFTVINKDVIRKSIDAESTNNVFLFNKEGFNSLYIENLRVPSPVSCITNTDGQKLNIKYINNKNEVFVLIPVDEDYCKKADSNSPRLCDELNVFMYDGYKQGCCEKFGVCCS